MAKKTTTRKAAKDESGKQLVAYAFWEYDLFPYMLGGKVEQVLPGGYVKTSGYAGMNFKPIKIILGDEGRQMLDALEALRAEKRAASNELDEAFNQRLVALAPFVKDTGYTLRGT